VLEIDITSYSDVQDYRLYRVPEVWLVRNQRLIIYQFDGDDYAVQSRSRFFPGDAVSDWVTRCFAIAYERNTSAAIRELRQRLTDERGNSTP
jgi:hypothetical protein